MLAGLNPVDADSVNLAPVGEAGRQVFVEDPDADVDPVDQFDLQFRIAFEDIRRTGRETAYVPSSCVIPSGLSRRIVPEQSAMKPRYPGAPSPRHAGSQPEPASPEKVDHECNSEL